jgi:hypothetical protein
MRALNNIKITNKVALVLSTLICVSGATSVIGYQSLAKQEQTAVMTEHTYKVVGTLDSLMAAMVDQETGMRGYLPGAAKKGRGHFRKGTRNGPRTDLRQPGAAGAAERSRGLRKKLDAANC